MSTTSEKLAEALRDAATSLQTISRLAGRATYLGDDGERIPTYMEHDDDVRGYAKSRAQVAQEALAAYESQKAQPTRSQLMRDAGYTRRPSLPKDGDEDDDQAVPALDATEDEIRANERERCAVACEKLASERFQDCRITESDTGAQCECIDEVDAAMIAQSGEKP